MARLFLIRHGITTLQKEDRYWGSTDIQLNDVGIKQAKQLRDRLAAKKITHVYCSTLSRSIETAKIIAAVHQKDITACPELCEFNFGFAEGLTYEEMKKLHPALAEELAKMGPVSFPGGESLDQFFARTMTFLKRLKKHKAQDIVAIIGHAGSLRMLICHLLEMEMKHWHRMRIEMASISVVDTYPGICILNSLNDTSHLKAGRK